MLRQVVRPYVRDTPSLQGAQLYLLAKVIIFHQFSTFLCLLFEGQHGYRVIGPNGNHIFLPASGCKFTCSEVFKKNETGMYWTSTQKGKGKIWCLMFASKFYDIYNGKYNEGYSIRPVW